MIKQGSLKWLIMNYSQALLSWLVTRDDIQTLRDCSGLVCSFVASSFVVHSFSVRSEDFFWPNEYPNIFVRENLWRTNIRIYSVKDEWPNEYLNIFVHLKIDERIFEYIFGNKKYTKRILEYILYWYLCKICTNLNIYDNEDDSYKAINNEEEVTYFINVDERDDDASRKNDILHITPNKLQNIIFNSLLMLL